MHRVLILIIAGLFTACSNPSPTAASVGAAAGADNGLRPWPQNENVWSWDGETPVLLLGASNHRAPFLVEEAIDELEYLIKTGGSYVRTTLPASAGLSEVPFSERFSQMASGSSWNENYWKKLEEYLSYAASRSVAVKIEVWDYLGTVASPWDSSLWNTQLEALPDSIYRRNYFEGEHPFYQTVPASVAYRDELLPVLRMQERFVDKLLAVTGKYRNVIYDVRVPDNMLIPWMVYWGRYLEKAGEATGRTYNVQLGIEPLRRTNVAAFNQTVLNGGAVAYHPAPPLGGGMNGRALASIRGVRVLEQHFEFTDLRPAPELLGENTGRAQAATDGQGNYAVYLPSAGDVVLSPDWAEKGPVDVIVVGYLGTQRSELLEPPYEDTFRLYTDEEKGGWLLLKPRTDY